MSANRPALNDLWIGAEAELKRLARRRLRLERAGHTLGTMDLVNEVYLRLSAQRSVKWQERGQFFALAAQAMRRLLIDYARRRKPVRERVRYDSVDASTLNDDPRDRAVQLAASERGEELLALDDALGRFAAVDERAAQVVECRFFAGYTEDETAAALGVTPRTVARDWAKAKAWLYQDLTNTGADGTP
ncbi:MAG: ECF-type sigma factor [Gemmatimonadaceae bacterium]